MRLNRYLARAGVASRRKSESLILDAKVSVNGKIITDLATNIDPGHDTVEIAGEIIELPQYVYFALNKPAGYTCTRLDKHAKKTVYELLPPDSSLITIGRLDRDTTGLLLLTNDGDFAQNIIHPSKKIIKKYLVTTKANLNHTDATKLTKGVKLEDGPATAISALILDDHKIEIAIEEGRKRIVRRMIKALNHEVVSLKRVQIGDIRLDINEGQYRPLTKKEIGPYV